MIILPLIVKNQYIQALICTVFAFVLWGLQSFFDNELLMTIVHVVGQFFFICYGLITLLLPKRLVMMKHLIKVNWFASFYCLVSFLPMVALALILFGGSAYHQMTFYLLMTSIIILPFVLFLNYNARKGLFALQLNFNKPKNNDELLRYLDRAGVAIKYLLFMVFTDIECTPATPQKKALLDKAFAINKHFHIIAVWEDEKIKQLTADNQLNSPADKGLVMLGEQLKTMHRILTDGYKEIDWWG